jgi:hypothetical protein
MADRVPLVDLQRCAQKLLHIIVLDYQKIFVMGLRWISNSDAQNQISDVKNFYPAPTYPQIMGISHIDEGCNDLILLDYCSLSSLEK